MASFFDLDTASTAASPSPVSPPSDRPRVVIEDPGAGKPQNPLFPYLIGVGVVASVLLIGIIFSIVYHVTTSSTLKENYANASAAVTQAKGQIDDFQSRLSEAQQELSLYREDQANLTTVLVSARQNYSDKVNEVGQCQNTLVGAQGEIRRLQNLQAANCDTLIGEVKSDCNLAIDRLFSNATAACGDVVDDRPDASGDEVRDEVEDRVEVRDYKFPGIS